MTLEIGRILDWSNCDFEFMKQIGFPVAREDGWLYRDFPGRFSSEDWQTLLSIIGPGNYAYISYSCGERDGKTFERGSMYVSPAGIEALERARVPS